MAKKRIRIDETVVAAYADDLASIVPMLEIPNLTAFWQHVRQCWSAPELALAIDAFKADGSLDAFRLMLARTIQMKPVGYWNAWEHVVEALREAEAKLGRFPTLDDLEAMGQGGLVDSIAKRHGGMRAVRERMGIPTEARRPGAWDDWAAVEAALREIIDETGGFPTYDEIHRRKIGGLLHAVVTKFGGLTAVRKRMGATRVSRAKIPVREEVERDLRAIAEKLGHFPTGSELETLGRSDLTRACQNHFSGLAETALRMGFVPKKYPGGYWEFWENAEPVLLDVIGELNAFPTAEELAERGLSKLSAACTAKFGSLAATARHYGKPIRQHARGQWNTWEKVEPMLLEIIKELGRFPTAKDLWANGYSGLVPCMRLYGGFSAVRAKMGYDGYLERGHWQNWGNVTAELRPIIDRLGRFPSAGELRKEGKDSLITSIQKYHGGLHAAAKKLGFAPHQHAAGHWKEWPNVEAEMRSAIAAIGHFPGQVELVRNGFGHLPTAVKYHGGLLAVRERMGYGPITDALLASHADALARIVPAAVASGAFWSTIKESWTARDLANAIEEYERNGSVERFKSLADG